MSDDNQITTTPDPSTTSAAQSADQSAEQAANEALANPGGLNVSMPDLNDIEYATPSAYIDPDLPAYNPEQKPEEEAPAETTEEQDTLEMTPEQIADMVKASHAVMSRVAEKIANSKNILIATSGDPSVDELAAAIALSLFLDRLGKHAIAIHSGDIPKALEFLKPEDIFEKDADVFQDFVISVDKEKADHLRYKLDGDFVKVFITPYHDKITAEDLEYSYGDYNVDLALALNVDNGVDLDPSLREHGLIMQNATVINITTGNPGKFGEIEWNNKRSSSISEMIADLLCNASGDTKLNSEEATALLAGIVASTDRFARANTVSTTMQIASQLIENGANPQLVAENVTEDVDNQFFKFSDLKSKDSENGEEDKNSLDIDSPSFSFEPTKEPEESVDPNDDTALKIAHGEEEQAEPESKTDEKELTEKEPEEKGEPEEDSTLLNELKATEASLSGITTPESTSESAPAIEPTPALESTPTPEPAPAIEPVPTPTLATDFASTSKYSQMLEDALNEPAGGEATPMNSSLPPADAAAPATNPAATSAPKINATPEINGMPEINYGQSTGDVLPPPPAPPIDMSSPMPIPMPSDVASSPSLVMPEGATAAPSDVPATPPAPTTPAPDAFTIPGV
ncbi:hypothetical protein IKG24_02555 [Candidatus Saccharibacteria bacterium]|nr:hypothetical protein [Candidatus Saccharibacteria bacterium]